MVRHNGESVCEKWEILAAVADVSVKKGNTAANDREMKH